MSVVIYSKTNCASCEQAKMVLKSRGIEFEVKVLDKDYTMENLMDTLDEIGLMGFRTFPLIVQGGKGFTFATIDNVVLTSEALVAKLVSGSQGPSKTVDEVKESLKNKLLKGE